MLKLDLNELFTPDLIEAFQKQWAGLPDVALAQAEEAIRMLIEPRDRVERSIAELVLNLVGPEPDGLAWLAAMARRGFKLDDSVTHVVSRVKQSPAQGINRQRGHIKALATSPRARRADAEVIRLAYNDALRLMVASSVLAEMRSSVTARAALGRRGP